MENLSVVRVVKTPPSAYDWSQDDKDSDTPEMPTLDEFEEALRERLKTRAAELGLTLKDLLTRAAIDKSNFYRGPARRLDTLFKLAEACEWDLAQILGVASQPIDVDLLLLAYRGAEKYCEALPPAARSRAAFVETQATIYDLGVARRRRGEPFERAHADEAAELMASVWRRNHRR